MRARVPQQLFALAGGADAATSAFSRSRRTEGGSVCRVHDDVFLSSRYKEVLAETTDWVAQHLNDPHVRIVESDEDVLLYETGHIPGAVKIDWHTDEQDQVKRDFIDKAGFERLMSSRGIANDTTVVFYGDKNNWYACYTFWLFKLYTSSSSSRTDSAQNPLAVRRQPSA
jgi:thiosulfate/3-mercaptopyruvate sulfurtransferase